MSPSRRCIADGTTGKDRKELAINAAIRTGGPMAIHGAFQVLGQLAMREAMTDKDVTSAMSMLHRYLDKQ